MSINPYQSPQEPSTAIAPSSGWLKHRCCPECGAPVPWTRFWFKAWLWARWPCQACGVSLQFNMWRRLATVAVAFALMLPVWVLVPIIGILLPTLKWPVFIAAMALCFILAAAASLLDGVTRASQDR